MLSVARCKLDKIIRPVTSTWDMLQLVAGWQPGICGTNSCPKADVTGQPRHRRLSDCITGDWNTGEVRHRHESRRCRHECPRHVKVTGQNENGANVAPSAKTRALSLAMPDQELHA